MRSRAGTTAVAAVFLLAASVCQGMAAEGKEQPGVRPTAKGMPATWKTAEDCFREAKQLAEQDPREAARLYRQGLAVKTDARPQRKELALLYEKQRQWSDAAYEYELLQKGAPSPESYTDLIRALKGGGFFGQAARKAREAHEKFGGSGDFLLAAGELYFQSGETAEAVAVLSEAARINPRSGRPHFLLGKGYEKTGKTAAALGEYGKAAALDGDDREAADAVRRLKGRGVTVAGVTVVAPAGWTADRDGLVNAASGARVVIAVQDAGDPAALALEAARKVMPAGMFSDERIRMYGQSGEKAAELAKTAPELGEKLRSLPMPYYGTGEVREFSGGRMVLLATHAVPRPGTESAVAAAVPVRGKVYTFLWKGAASVADGEKVVREILGGAVWAQ